MAYKHTVDARKWKTDRYRDRREAAVAYLGGACVSCGTTEDLEFDHVDPATKTREMARCFGDLSAANLAVEVAKCQLLCKPCHITKSQSGREYDAPQKGERNGRAKVTAEQVREIRRRYAAGGTTHQALADEYGVTKTNIRFIIKRVSWAHVTDGQPGRATVSA